MRKPSARGTISREAVVDAALAIADRAGFDAVTMRAIAAEVGATPMALYAYFSDKNALYGGMRERIFSAHVGVGSAKISRDTWQSMLEGMARIERGQIFQVLTPEQQSEVRKKVAARHAAEQQGKKKQPGRIIPR